MISRLSESMDLITKYKTSSKKFQSYFHLQDIAFINPANVVFVYLLVRDCVDHNIVKETELQVRPLLVPNFVTVVLIWHNKRLCSSSTHTIPSSGCGPRVSLSLLQLHGERDQLPPQAFPR